MKIARMYSFTRRLYTFLLYIWSSFEIHKRVGKSVMSCTWQTENRKWEILHFSVKAEFSTDGKISQSLGLETSAASFARCEHCPTRTWRRPRGRGQGSLRTRRQATSKDRLAPLSPQRCCWTLRWGWTGGCLFWKLKKLFLQRASTWNSDKAFDSLFFCRFLQDLLRAVHGRAPHISYIQDNSDLSNFSKGFFVSYLYCWILSQVSLWLLEEWCQGSLHPTCVIIRSDLI